jgi:uncharacterized protein
MDVLEKSLYNGLISGIGLDGKSFFYTNAMQIRNHFSHHAMEPTRSGWFDCSCCPTNLTRLIPSIPGYVYAQKGNDIYVNLFINSKATLSVQNKPVIIEQQNRYPWDGNLVFKLTPAKATAFNMLVRIPGWAQNEAIPSNLYQFTNTVDAKPVIKVNGQPIEYNIANGYATIARTWKKNDVVEVVLPMDVRQVTANEKVKDDIGKVALQRGPMIYCAEWVDNNGRAANIIIPSGTSFSATYNPGLLNGVEVLTADVPVIRIDQNGQQVTTTRQTFTAIPYYAWANRGKGEMTIWFPQKISDIEVIAGNADGNIIPK